MHWDELRAGILASPPDPGDLVYVSQHGTDYSWSVLGDGTEPPHGGSSPPDAWIYYSGPWPVDDPSRQAAFFDDLRAELESMTGNSDRCRWPLDEPWPHGH